MRWEAGLEGGARETPCGPRGWGTGMAVGTAAVSVLGDLAVVFGMDVPAQADGKEHPQELSRKGMSQRRRYCPVPPRSQSSILLSKSTCRVRSGLSGSSARASGPACDSGSRRAGEACHRAAEGPGRLAAGPLEADRPQPPQADQQSRDNLGGQSVGRTAGEGIQTSMTATPTHTPRMMPRLSCSHACTLLLQPYKEKHSHVSRGHPA